MRRVRPRPEAGPCQGAAAGRRRPLLPRPPTRRPSPNLSPPRTPCTPGYHSFFYHQQVFKARILMVMNSSCLQMIQSVEAASDLGTCHGSGPVWVGEEGKLAKLS